MMIYRSNLSAEGKQITLRRGDKVLKGIVEFVDDVGTVYIEFRNGKNIAVPAEKWERILKNDNKRNNGADINRLPRNKG